MSTRTCSWSCAWACYRCAQVQRARTCQIATYMAVPKYIAYIRNIAQHSQHYHTALRFVPVDGTTSYMSLYSYRLQPYHIPYIYFKIHYSKT